MAQAQRFLTGHGYHECRPVGARKVCSTAPLAARYPGDVPVVNAVIRPVEARDAAAVASIYAPHVTEGVASFETTSPDADEMAARIVATTESHPWLVCDAAGQGTVGYVYAAAFNPRAAYQWSVGVTVYVDERFHRAGIGRALYTSLFALLRLQGFYNAYGGITLPNAGSVGLHEAMGFRPAAMYKEVGFKFGRWWDVGWWELELLPKPAVPAGPLKPEAVRELPGWQKAVEAGLPLLRL